MKTLLSGIAAMGALALAMGLPGQTAHAAAPPSPVVAQADAKKHFDAGVRAAKASQWEAARAEFLLAWQAEESYKTAANLGRVEIELGQHRDAAEHLIYCLRNATEMSAAQKATVQELFDEARARVGLVEVGLVEVGAEILVDGVVAGKTPLGGIFVEPGRRTISARKAGKTFEAKPVDIAAGATEEVTIREKRPESSQIAEQRRAEALKERESSWKSWAVPVGAGVSLVGIGVGAGLTVAANQRDAAAGGQDAMTSGAVAGYVVGGMAAVGTIVMLLWPTEDPRRTGVFVTPIVFGGQGGVRVVGAF